MKYFFMVLRGIYFLFRLLSYIIGALLFLYGLLGTFGMSFAGSFSDFYIQLFAFSLCISGAIYLVPYSKYNKNNLLHRTILGYQVLFNVSLILYLLFDFNKQNEIIFSLELIHYIAIMSVVALISIIVNPKGLGDGKGNGL